VDWCLNPISLAFPVDFVKTGREGRQVHWRLNTFFLASSLPLYQALSDSGVLEHTRLQNVGNSELAPAYFHLATFSLLSDLDFVEPSLLIWMA